MSNVANQFLAALAGALPADERMILCAFPGDPEKAGPTAWRPRPWFPGRDVVLNEKWNGYCTVASFRRAGDGSFRRRTETFAGGLALMVDDVGTKIAPGVVEHMPPSAIVETSPGNFQWWYFLDKPEYDMARFDAVIRAFISGTLLGADPGMSGVTRVGRLPGFLNGKAKYGGWITRLEALEPERRFSVEALLEGFQLKLNGRREPRTRLHSAEAVDRNRAYMGTFKFLDKRGMLKRDEPDPSGWTEMSCPWVDGHTNSVDTGAAIREPAEENEYYGAFRCHHGHCIDKGWAELTDWVAELAAEELNDAAEAAE